MHPDQVYMQRCLDLARRALGRTAPNPLVGAVVVRDGEIVGEGFHPQAGQPHAEVFALATAGERARGATLYVNLEPCNHHGRTPPCTEAVIAAGIQRVVVGMIDPDQRVQGGGVARLRQAGLEVTVGVEEANCQTLNEPFSFRVIHGRPLGLLKYAMTLDGKIATSAGHSAWITGPEARTWVHHLRASCDAVVIGGNTLRRDDPHLTTRQAEGHQPLRVVMSRTLTLPEEAHLWKTDFAPTLVLTQEGTDPQRQDALRQRGVEVVALPELRPAAAMAHFYQRGFLSVLWECGGILAAQAIQDHAIQKVFAFVAPKIIGGQQAPSPVADLGLTAMTDALALERVRVEAIGPDWLIQGYLKCSTPEEIGRAGKP